MAGVKKNWRSKKTVLAIAITGTVAFIVGFALMFRYGERFFTPLPEGPLREVSLFFSAEGGKFLEAERRGVAKGALTAEIREVVEELIKGPSKSRGLQGVIPQGTRLISLEIKGPTAFIDLSSEIKERHWGGTSAELQTVYAIVNTVTLNFPRIRSVQIMVEGEIVETLAGHILINTPLGPDEEMIKGFKKPLPIKKPEKV